MFDLIKTCIFAMLCGVMSMLYHVMDHFFSCELLLGFAVHSRITKLNEKKKSFMHVRSHLCENDNKNVSCASSVQIAVIRSWKVYSLGQTFFYSVVVGFFWEKNIWEGNNNKTPSDNSLQLTRWKLVLWQICVKIGDHLVGKIKFKFKRRFFCFCGVLKLIAFAVQ